MGFSPGRTCLTDLGVQSCSVRKIIRLVGSSPTFCCDIINCPYCRFQRILWIALQSCRRRRSGEAWARISHNETKTVYYKYAQSCLVRKIIRLVRSSPTFCCDIINCPYCRFQRILWIALQSCRRRRSGEAWARISHNETKTVYYECCRNRGWGVNCPPSTPNFYKSVNPINPSIYNIIRWFVRWIGQTTSRPSVWRSKHYFFFLKYCKIVWKNPFKSFFYFFL